MAIHRSRPHAAAVLLLAVAAALCVLPAASAISCEFMLTRAVQRCRKDMDKVLAAGADAAADLTAAQGCCDAATAVFSTAFMSDCACSEAVLGETVGIAADKMEALHKMTALKCSADAVGWPTCAAPQALVSPAQTNTSGNVTGPPINGAGSLCTSTTKCSAPKCPSAGKSFDKFKAKCMKNENKGFCDIASLTSVCGGPAMITENLTPVDVTKNGVTEKCFSCCESAGIRPNMCKTKGRGSGGCFPGAATVQVPGGQSKAMSSLKIGDQILVLKPDGSTGFEEVYFFDHEVQDQTAEFVVIGLVNGRSIELTAGHFVPVGSSLKDAVMRRASAVEPGMPMLVLSEDGATSEPVLVDSVGTASRPGMFAPVTGSGTVIVDGVIASAFSDWALDPIFDALGLTHLLPRAMHHVHAPARWAYALLGPKVVAALSPVVTGIAMLDSRQLAAGLGMASGN